jgi:hypothetical protein
MFEVCLRNYKVMSWKFSQIATSCYMGTVWEEQLLQGGSKRLTLRANIDYIWGNNIKQHSYNIWHFSRVPTTGVRDKGILQGAK